MTTAPVLDVQVLVRPDRRTGPTVESTAQAEQLRAVDVSRLGERLGSLDAETAAALDDALLIHLALA
ncbi:type II toxin-antitoxin system PemK/MazF family toxin [Cellulomonas olei]|uniref:type II toxin-antitoxin system PemK/MazF family toxin n=1 Tax=Cellulomonas sp. P4 TaxID=3142533 RepID=UPI0031BB2DA4